MPNLKLHNYFRSSTSFRVRIALHYKKLSFEYIPVHLLKDEQHLPEYKKLNPMQGVPTLDHDGKLIGQSMAILFYLDQEFPEIPIFPRGAYERAKVIQLCESINADTHAYTNLRTLRYLEKNLSLSETARAQWSLDWTRTNLTGLEKLAELHSKKYFWGDSITAADFTLIPALLTAERFKVDLQDFPNLLRVNKNCLAHDSFAAAHPYRQIDTPDELKIK